MWSLENIFYVLIIIGSIIFSFIKSGSEKKKNFEKTVDNNNPFLVNLAGEERENVELDNQQDKNLSQQHIPNMKKKSVYAKEAVEKEEKDDLKTEISNQGLDDLKKMIVYSEIINRKY